MVKPDPDGERMLGMSNPYDQNPQNQQPGSNPYQPPPGQYPAEGGAAPYGQSSPPPYGQPSPTPYGQPASSPYGQPSSSPYGQASPTPYGQASPAPYGQPYGVATQEHPQGTIIFVLGIVGIFVGVCAPIAWYLGNKTLREITASGASYSNVSQIRTGRMLGKVFTIIYLVLILLYIVFFVVIFGIAASQGGF
jgi:hypothetical protein